MGRVYKNYTKELKEQACKLVVEKNIPVRIVAEKLSVRVQLLKWLNQYESYGQEAFFGFFGGTSLLVIGALFCNVRFGGNIEFVAHNRIAARNFVNACGAVAYPLAGYENGHFDMKGKHHLFKGRGVIVPQKIVDKRSVFAHCFGTRPV